MRKGGENGKGERKREKERERERERERESGSERDGDPLHQDIGQDLAVDSRSFPSDSRALFLPIPRPDRHKTQVTPVFMPVVFTPVATPVVLSTPLPCSILCLFFSRTRATHTHEQRNTGIYSRVSVRPVTPSSRRLTLIPVGSERGGRVIYASAPV